MLEKYPYPEGRILNAELTQRVNSVVSFQPGRLPFAALYINPNDAFLLPYSYPNDLKDLFNSYSQDERRAVRRTFGALLKYLYNKARLEKTAYGVENEQELHPNLNFIRGFTPVSLESVRGMGRNGILFTVNAVVEIPPTL